MRLWPCTDGQVKFVELPGGTVTGQVALPGAFGIALSTDGNTLYVTTNGGEIVLMNVATRTITKRYATGGQPRQIVVLPGGDSAMAANMGGGSTS